MSTKFNCSLPVFIQTGLTLWENAENNLTALTAYKSKYTTTFINARKAAILNAQNMPDDAARSAVHEGIRLTLIDNAKTCLSHWRNLKSYCRDAYPDKEMMEVQLMAAGWGYYEEAAASNWPSVRSLMNSGLNFINTNSGLLESEGFMPAGFPVAFANSMGTFEATYASFITAQQTAKAGTDARNTALNNCYADVISLCLDGQDAFDDNETIKEQFVFETVCQLVSPPGPAGLKGYATYEINGQPVVGLTAEIEGTDKQAVTNPAGFYDFGPLSSGGYTVKYKLGDEVMDTEQVSIPTGTTVTRNVAIQQV